MQMWDSNAPARFANINGGMVPFHPIFLGDSPACPSPTSQRMELSDTWIPVSSKMTSLTFLADIPSGFVLSLAYSQVAVLHANESLVCKHFS